MIGDLNFQHGWKKLVLWAEDFLSAQTVYTITSALAAAADRATALATATAFATSRAIPANTLKVGDVIEVQASCLHVAQNGADTQLITLKVATTIIAASAAMSIAAGGAQGVYARGVVSAIGASGVISFLGQSGSMTAGAAAADAGSTLVLPIDTTATITFTVHATHSANSAGNQSDLRQFDVRVHRFAGIGPDATVGMEEVNALGLRGWKMNTAGERVRRLFAIPDIDTDRRFRVRPLWTTGSSTAADTIVWKTSVKVQTIGSALTVSTPTTVSHSDTASDTAFQLFAGPSAEFSAGVVDNQDLFMIEVEMDNKAGGLTEDIFFLGLELLYIPVVVVGTGVSDPAMPTGWTD